MHTCAVEALESYAHRIVRAMGADEDVAQEVARHLVRANMSGHDSHGVIRIPQYVGQADRRELVPASRPVVIRETPTTLLVDTKRGFGHFATAFALDRLTEKARRYGTASVALRHCTHIGRLGEYTERCSASGLVLIVTVGMAGPGVGGVVIHGGRERFFGANVWSIGVPGTSTPLVFDASTSSIAVGKVLVAQASGSALPPGCLIDREGEPSVNPDDYANGGAVLPLGGALAGHKGYGLALASALLGGLAMIGDPEPTLAGAPVRAGASPRGRVAGVFMIAIDPEAFGGTDEYRALVEDCLAAAKAVPPAPGSSEVLIPGEKSRRARERSETAGVELPDATYRELARIGERFGIGMPAAMASAQPPRPTLRRSAVETDR